jgi:hypothetical protein
VTAISESDLCTYCDQPAQEPDHVPPACIFPSPRPSNLITVPSCRACNLGYSKDDEYLKQVLAMRHDISEQPRAQPMVDSVFRALARKEAQRHTAMMLRSLIEYPVRSPGGLHLGTAMAYHVNLHRLRRSLARTTRALYRHECKDRLPLAHVVTVAADLTVDAETAQAALGHLAGRPVQTIGNGVFRYAFVLASGRPGASLWLMEFYEAYAAVAFTLDSDAKADAEALRARVTST